MRQKSAYESKTEVQCMQETNDEAAADLLRAFLNDLGTDVDYNENQIRQLFEEGGFRTRFGYLSGFFDEVSKAHVLISGAAIGTEMKLAIEYGFQCVTGTEIHDAYVKICERRFTGDSRLTAVLYNGDKLPFEDNNFSGVISGHIIEHTRNPKLYLREHMRVMQKGGYMFLEFPTRYHTIELHTRLPSFEWLPRPLRYVALKIILWRRSPFSERTRNGYRAVLETLQPISHWQIRWWLKRMPWRSTIENWSMPAPGIVRVIIRKVG